MSKKLIESHGLNYITSVTREKRQPYETFGTSGSFVKSITSLDEVSGGAGLGSSGVGVGTTGAVVGATG